MKPDESRLHDVVKKLFATRSDFAGEDAFQRAFAVELGSSERELRAEFEVALFPPRRPPQSAIDDLASRKKPVRIPSEGRDPCARAAKLDILWHTTSGAVPIELKYRPHWNADTYGYMFLKDLHRLERIHTAGGKSVSEVRFALFVTTSPHYWSEAGSREPKPFRIHDGHATPACYWAQYDQNSPDTLWYRYPPFHLANPYRFRWTDLGRAGRYLLVPVFPQTLRG